MSAHKISTLQIKSLSSRQDKQNQYSHLHHQLISPFHTNLKEINKQQCRHLFAQTQPTQPTQLQLQQENVEEHENSCADLCNFTLSAFNKNTNYHHNNGTSREHKKLKTASNASLNQTKNKQDKQNRQSFIKSFYNPSKEFIRSHKPFLENKRIIFNVKSRNNHNRNIFIKRNKCKGKGQEDSKEIKGESNIQKLKREILELDKEDFASYRSKSYSNTDEIRIIENEKINKYNHQNSMIVEWKGKTYYKPCVARPSTTMAINMTHSSFNSTGITTALGNYVGFTSFSSAPKKYFSKPKSKHIDHNQSFSLEKSSNKNSSKENINTIVRKTQQIAVGLNMFRGKMHRKKVNSSFQGY